MREDAEGKKAVLPGKKCERYRSKFGLGLVGAPPRAHSLITVPPLHPAEKQRIDCVRP